MESSQCRYPYTDEWTKKHDIEATGFYVAGKKNESMAFPEKYNWNSLFREKNPDLRKKIAHVFFHRLNLILKACVSEPAVFRSPVLKRDQERLKRYHGRWEIKQWGYM